MENLPTSSSLNDLICGTIEYYDDLIEDLSREITNDLFIEKEILLKKIEIYQKSKKEIIQLLENGKKEVRSTKIKRNRIILAIRTQCRNKMYIWSISSNPRKNTNIQNYIKNLHRRVQRVRRIAKEAKDSVITEMELVINKVMTEEINSMQNLDIILSENHACSRN